MQVLLVLVGMALVFVLVPPELGGFSSSTSSRAGEGGGHHHHVLSQYAHAAAAAVTSFTNPVLLQNQKVGTVVRLCPHTATTAVDASSTTTACLLSSASPPESSENVHVPIPIRVRSWMHPQLRENDNEYLLFYSAAVAVSSSTEEPATANNKNATATVVRVLGTPGSIEEGPWRQLTSQLPLDFASLLPSASDSSSPACKQRLFRLNSVTADDSEEVLYMHVTASSSDSRRCGATTALLRSKDGLAWERGVAGTTPSSVLPEGFSDFSPSTIRGRQERHPADDSGYYYGVAFRDDAEGLKGESQVTAAYLVRSKTSALGPYEAGPRIGRGFRSVDLHVVAGRYIAVFFTLIGDGTHVFSARQARIPISACDYPVLVSSTLNLFSLCVPTILQPPNGSC